ncbi:DNA-binding transcriptional regulator, MarR family [Chitinophaga terrae (ex Kim and Jung 2007)]|jgi:DNA-binding MarR family transcriptional regulator|uniref:DNA-binding transcriptional regulator, MarR family n=1 Tax=Chitinophaga terrae (ex Kim and Jung 2007) TaxID=408074 RepID=A0A1H4FDN6_9BACT|nr:MarR family transcriptional regulator [Chitinophaga terrae (ex Kim and Jung 2007)]MDQ0110175.1 DNA-binding MarR family transcriptional regulator [Chitinophaga terrae (ex Kim and Jung 2007)]GEP92412.1 MarR family transcriptional regulator [Chitinophaga terrae (ex Kim and Jung 2007)]SEA95444.1 DNA-binding transcriptional regulator, MarR family [Chitinophaga terrae (ex Kim and Jung 2007)]
MKLEDELKQPRFKDEYQRAMLNIIFTGSWLEVRTNQVLKPFDLSSQQFNVLRILRGSRPRPLNLLDIQERMMDKMSNATRLVEKLRQKGLLTRKQCDQNRRKVEIEITDKGMELLGTLDPLMEELHKSFSGKLTVEEANHINVILDKLRD